MATVEFQGTPGSGIATGPAHLVSLTFSQPGAAFLVGSLDVITVGPAMKIVSAGSGGGTLAGFGTGGLSLVGNPGLASGAAHCSGPTCFPALGLPPSIPVLLTGAISGNLYGTVTSPTAPTVAFTIPVISLGSPIGGTGLPVPVYLALTGAQVGARTHIATPEPGTLPLLASGVAVAAGLAWRARRRRS